MSNPHIPDYLSEPAPHEFRGSRDILQIGYNIVNKDKMVYRLEEESHYPRGGKGQKHGE
jgi:hypothetical protein